jgi:hypothetical protein
MDLLVDDLISRLRTEFSLVKDGRASNCRYNLIDNLMSGFAIFHQKDPSLLAFREQFKSRSENMKRIYSLDSIPEDTGLRECLDKVDPQDLHSSFKALLDECRNSGLLRSKQVLGNKLLISFDGTGYFSSNHVQCPHCLVKSHKNGKTTYHHQMLGAVLVHPDQNTVLPVTAEPIVKTDGSTKNDCEINALKRLLPIVRKVLEKDELIAILDGLYANGPTIQALNEVMMDYLICIKEGFVLIQADKLRKQDQLEQLVISDGKVKTTIRWANGLILNGAHLDMSVNYVECEQVDIKTQALVYKSAWITNLTVDQQNAKELVKAARSRWKIENETFNTLKNQGYHLEHNYGHGKKFLSSVFAMLMLLAFAVDQIAQAADKAFQKAMAKFKTRQGFWKRVSAVFDLLPSMSMNAIYRFIAGEIPLQFQQLE